MSLSAVQTSAPTSAPHSAQTSAPHGHGQPDVAVLLCSRAGRVALLSGFVAVAAALALAVSGRASALDVTAAGVLLVLLGVPLSLMLVELTGLVRSAFGPEEDDLVYDARR